MADELVADGGADARIGGADGTAAIDYLWVICGIGGGFLEKWDADGSTAEGQYYP